MGFSAVRPGASGPAGVLEAQVARGRAQGDGPKRIPQPGDTLTGTVKTYSAVKGYGFIMHNAFPHDVRFARESLLAGLRTSDIAGTNVSFMLAKAPDGKLWGQQLRPLGSVPMGSGLGMSGLVCQDGFVGQPPARPGGSALSQATQPAAAPAGALPAGRVARGFSDGPPPGVTLPAAAPAVAGQRPAFQVMGPPLIPGPQLRLPGAPLIGLPGQPFIRGPGVMPLNPMNFAGLAGTPQRRAFSPHAGSRAIALAQMAAKAAAGGAAGAKKTGDDSSSESSKRSRSSPRGRGKKKKQKKQKKKGKKRKRSDSSGSSKSASSASGTSKGSNDDSKNKKKNESSGSSSSSGNKRRRKRSRSRRKGATSGAAADDDDGNKESADSKEVQEAKLEALQALTKLQGVESKDTRLKEFRSLLRAWHPDKNPDKVEVATAVFQFLQKGKSLLDCK